MPTGSISIRSYRKYALLSGMGYFLDGYNLTVVAVFTFILSTYGIMQYTPFEMGFVSGSALLGAMAGAILLGRYSDLSGRRYIYILYVAFFIIFPLLSSISTNIIEVIVFRFLLGIGIGADYAIGPVYSTEMYPDRKRGTGYGMVWAFWSLGASVAFIIGYSGFAFLGAQSWRLALGFSAAPAVGLILLRAGIPESERWKSASGKTSTKNVQGTHTRKKFDSKTSLSSIFRGDYGKRTAIIWIQWILLDIGSYGFGLYAPLIIGNFGFHGSETFLITSSLYAIGFIGAFVSMSWNDTIGRRPLQIFGFGFMALGMALMALAVNLRGLSMILSGIVGLILWFGVENIGPGKTMGLYAIELLPTRLRSTSMGAATGITRLVSFLSAFEFPYIAVTIGASGFLYILFFVMLGAFLFTILFTPETRGLTLDEIEDAVYSRHNLVQKKN
ncbi:D-xylose transporter XylE [Thermoplasmatales archaeon]|nr:D-xylose transporter XylE [Thermoplasmatales archaeon]